MSTEFTPPSSEPKRELSVAPSVTPSEYEGQLEKMLKKANELIGRLQASDSLDLIKARAARHHSFSIEEKVESGVEITKGVVEVTHKVMHSNHVLMKLLEHSAKTVFAPLTMALSIATLGLDSYRLYANRPGKGNWTHYLGRVLFGAAVTVTSVASMVVAGTTTSFLLVGSMAAQTIMNTLKAGYAIYDWNRCDRRWKDALEKQNKPTLSAQNPELDTDAEVERLLDSAAVSNKDATDAHVWNADVWRLRKEEAASRIQEYGVAAAVGAVVTTLSATVLFAALSGVASIVVNAVAFGLTALGLGATVMKEIHAHHAKQALEKNAEELSLKNKVTPTLTEGMKPEESLTEKKQDKNTFTEILRDSQRVSSLPTGGAMLKYVSDQLADGKVLEVKAALVSGLKERLNNLEMKIDQGGFFDRVQREKRIQKWVALRELLRRVQEEPSVPMAEQERFEAKAGTAELFKQLAPLTEAELYEKAPQILPEMMNSFYQKTSQTEDWLAAVTEYHAAKKVFDQAALKPTPVSKVLSDSSPGVPELTLRTPRES